MEIDEELDDKENETKKHARTVPVEEGLEGKSENTKKIKLFASKEFRKQLIQGNRLAALKQFLNAINESRKHDYVFEYLENGGNCLELLQTLELDSTIPPVLVFELVSHLLLKISANYAQYHGSAYESCRYILNNYVTLLNKMISLSSSSQERKVCLKLLTAMVTFSSALAKDILLHLNFHSTNVELLTKATGEKDSVRDHFVHFLTAFLVDGHYPTLSILLEKKGFITSIISGLQFDAADTVCVVISAMKNHILENPSVSKTAKMKTFNTSIVRDIVNLYNWKGPDALKAQKKSKNITFAVDEYSKSRVSECVHDFLLVLCTSHKFGVIFRDHSMGLGRKNQNALMYTVLESLERPWEHSYACELVTKICGASPDLAKTMWNNLKPFLEPRETQKWLNAMKFAKMLLTELQPACIEFCVKEHSVYQLAQIIQFLVAPLPILKTIIPEKHVFDSPSIKWHVVSLVLEMLKSLELYFAASTKWLTSENHKQLKKYITMFIVKNFLDAKTILDDWEVKNEADSVADAITRPKYLEIIFDIFDLYRSLAPQLLDHLGGSVELMDFLTKLHEVCVEDKNDLTKLRIKIINIFVDLDQSKFSPKTELFAFIVPLMLKFYYETTDRQALSVLHKLFKNTGVFEGCLHEINIWVNGILDLKNFDSDVAQSIAETLKITSENALQFSEELSKFKSEKDLDNCTEMIENLMVDNVIKEHKTVIIKHRYLSPMILGFIKHLEEAQATKNLKVYSNYVLLNLFHCQTQSEMLKQFIQRYDVLPANLKEYFLSWIDSKEIALVKKSKGRYDVFRSFSEQFLTGNIDNFLATTDLSLYEDLSLNLLQTSVFYVSNLLVNRNLTQDIVENCEKLVKHLIKNVFNDVYIETILGHPVLLYNMSFLNLEKSKPQSFSSKLLLTVITELLKFGFDIEGYLKVYREKLLSTILQILRKPQKYSSLPRFVETLRLLNLSYDQSVKVLSSLADFVQENEQVYPVVLDILNYNLEQVSHLCEGDLNLKPLNEDILQKLATHFVVLNNKQDINVSGLSLAFHKYLQEFPHNIEHLDPELFSSILNLNEYNKQNVSLAVFLLDRNVLFADSVKDNLNSICDKKGVILPLLQVLVGKNADESILKLIFEKSLPSFTKALQKPQKAGQHFHHNYRGVVVLIEKFMPLEKCHSFWEKVHKFEVAEIFHAKLLQAICNKVVNSDVSDKQVNNVIMTFVHLQMVLFKRKTKSDEDKLKLDDIAATFNDILNKLLPKVADKDLKATAQQETLKLYFKFCLKFGVSGQPILIKAMTSVINILANAIEQEESKLILDMLLSHSEFLNNVLGEHSEIKLKVLSLFLELCKNWGEFMERSHIPVLLASYRAMVSKCDRTILALLKMYESHAAQTNFYDFKPFLWGRAAASHYSVRLNIANALLRQPKMSDVLDILQDDLVQSTIVNYPLKDSLHLNHAEMMGDERSYDVKFLLPLFSQLLAPEQQVQTYKFTRSGALSLTIVGLSSQDKEVRQAACHVLSRFHFHVDARQTGKDNLLWIRYVEAVSKGTAILPDFRLNNFSAIYLARMALVLTQPNHVMYVPLSQHLTAKSALDFSTVPELYTFLHSCDVNFKEHRSFILKLLSDGLRTEKDFTDFIRSMAFKLFSELYSSSLSDLDTKLLILDVVKSVCKIPLGVKMLCENHSLLTQIFTVVNDVFMLPGKHKREGRFLISKIVVILLDVARTLQERHALFMIFTIIMNIVKDDCFCLLSDEDQKNIFQLLSLVFDGCCDLFTGNVVQVLLSRTNDKFCKYVFEYGCNFIHRDSLDASDKYYYLRLLFLGKLKK